MTHSNGEIETHSPQDGTQAPKAAAPGSVQAFPFASTGTSNGKIGHSWGVTPTAPARPEPQSKLNRFLNRVLTATGADALRDNTPFGWAIALTVIGLLSDLTQLFGDSATLKFVQISLSATLLFGVLVLFRTRFCARCSRPFVLSCFAAVLSCGIYGGQQLLAADNKGIIETMFPKATEIQIAIYEKITGIQVTVGETNKTAEKIKEQNDKLLLEVQKLSQQIAQIQAAQSPKPVPPKATEQAAEKLQEAISDLATAKDQKSKTAYEALKRGDTGEAERLFQSVLEEKAKEGKAAIKEAAAAARHLAAFKRLTNVAASRDLYTRAAELEPDEFPTWIDLGDMQVATGQLRAALISFERGYIIAQKLAASDPANTQGQRDLSVSHNRIGDIRRAQGDLAGALKAFETGLTIAEALARTDPSNTEWQRDLSISLDSIGDVRRAQGDLAVALKVFEASLAIRDTMARTDPRNTEWQRDLSVSHDKIGDIRVAQGDRTGALEAFEAGLAIRDTMARTDPRNTEWQRDLSVSHEKIGDIRASQGDRTGALIAFEAGHAIAEALARTDPRNTQWQRDLVVSHIKIGDIRRAQGDRTGALTAFEAGHAIAEALVRTDSRNTEWQRDLSISHNRIGDVRAAQGDRTGSLTAFEASLAIRDVLARTDPRNTEWQRDLAFSQNRIGIIHERLGYKAQALAAYKKSLEINERLAALDPTNAIWREDVEISRTNVRRLSPPR